MRKQALVFSFHSGGEGKMLSGLVQQCHLLIHCQATKVFFIIVYLHKLC